MFSSCVKPLRLICGASLLFGLSVSAAQVQAQSAAAASEIRFQQMEQEIRRLTGQIEEQNFEIRQLKEALRKMQADVDALRLGGGQSAIQQAPDFNVSPPSNATPSADGNERPTNTLGTLVKPQDGGAVKPSQDEAPRYYDYAYSFITNREFDKAEQAFAQFISDFPDHSLVANAKYWYGETFYVRGSYEPAARIFAEGYKNYPKSQKAPDNLLKLGMALIGMGKTGDACIALKQLKSQYSDASKPILKRADTEMGRIDCE